MRGLPVGRVGTVPVEVHWSWLLALALAITSLGAARFPDLYPLMPAAWHWVAAAATAALSSASIVAHEAAHAAVAARRGMVVRRVTLFAFGGVAQAGAEPARPGDELRIALAGPAASAAIAGCSAALAWALAHISGSLAADVVVAVLWQVALVNAVLAAFNLVPAFPLDGGRVLRAALWRHAGSRREATRLAALAGRGVATVLLVYGVTQLAAGRLVFGAWAASLGVFLDRAGALASDHERAAVDVQRLSGDEGGGV